MRSQIKNVLRNIVISVSKNMVKIANGSASGNYTYQPKEPVSITNFLNNKKG